MLSRPDPDMTGTHRLTGRESMRARCSDPGMLSRPAKPERMNPPSLGRESMAPSLYGGQVIDEPRLNTRGVPMSIAMLPTSTGPRPVRAPRGTARTCKGWIQEAALRMLMNNLDPEVAEDPDHLVVYGGNGKAARTWKDLDRIVAALRRLGNDETLLVQSGKAVGVLRTHELAPRVLIANSLLVPKWATWEEFRRLEAMGLTMYGQMTAGSWIYIGTQGILQGTYETFAACARRHFGGSLAGRLVVSAGLGGMGGA